MRKKFAYLSSAILATFMATGAQAAQVISIDGASGIYRDNAVACPTGTVGSCTFTRTFEFVQPVGFNLASIDIGSTLVSGNPMTDINFISVMLNNIEFLIGEEGTREDRFLADQPLLAKNVITVIGTSGGNAAFSGNLSFASVAAVPEPAAWMLMLIGMGGVGYSMRRKDKPTLRVRYT